jgi:DNA-binding transcriptional ArsR family regulator
VLANVLVGVLAEPVRLRAYAAVVLGATTPGEVAARTGLSHRDVAAALRRLEQVGLVSAVDGCLAAVVEVFKDAVREYATAAPPPEPLDDTARVYPERDVNAILRAWFPDYASLRRYLVDEELLAREHALYWRTGGPVDVAAGA